MKKLKSFDRYQYYRRAVQSPDVDCKFMSDAYKELRGKRPRLLREDFCGTFAICCSWVRRQKVNRAVGVDLDQEPIDYGRANYLSELRVDQQRRIKIVRENVMTTKVARVDIIAAFNFSFFIFKRRQDLRKYFAHARKGLKSKGLLMVDCFGGKDVQEANEERTDFRGFSYFWDQTGFDPVSNEALFHIHFKRKGERRRENVFSYDWRVWTIPEIREVMLEAGFKQTHVYWEGTTRKGEGDGNFKRQDVGEECDGWVAYIVGEV